jgi:uncharacterized repeat protein (TIGR01451 family)
MKKVSMLATASLTSVLATAAIAVPAYAWHPKGAINKSVQNQTAGTEMSDANDAASAVSATTGDILVYTIKVSNTGEANDKGMNDMAGTKLTDTLPAGLELADNAAQRTISDDLGTIKPGDSVTKTYKVKVTSTTDGDIITNKACYTGNSTANDNPQEGCDTAVVKVKVTTPETPTTPQTPTTPETPQGGSGETPTALPNTGSTALTATLFVTVAAGLGYAANMLRLKRQA